MNDCFTSQSEMTVYIINDEPIYPEQASQDEAGQDASGRRGTSILKFRNLKFSSPR